MGINKHRKPTIAPDSTGVMQDVAGGGGGGGLDDLATEQGTGLKDISGDDIYKKTVTKASMSAGENNVAHGIVGLKRLRSLEGSMKQASTGKWLPIPFASGYANIGAQVNVTSTTVDITLGSVWNNGDVTDLEITLLYTKS